MALRATEMPTSPILSYLVRQTEQNTIILFCLSKYDFPPNVCLPLSLSLLLMYFLPNNNFSLAFYLASLFGGNPTKIKS